MLGGYIPLFVGLGKMAACHLNGDNALSKKIEITDISTIEENKIFSSYYI